MNNANEIAAFADAARRELNSRKNSRHAWAWGDSFDSWYARFVGAMKVAADNSPSADEFMRLHRGGCRIDYINGEHMCNLLDDAAAELLMDLYAD